MKDETQLPDQFVDLWPLDTYIKSIWPFHTCDSKWTPKQIEAVTDYLTTELSEHAYRVFVENLYWKISGDTRQKQVKSILASHEPWDLHSASHDAAVQLTPSLEALVASELASDHAVSIDDVGWWLRNNATREQCIALVHELDPSDQALTSVDESSRYSLDIVSVMEVLRPDQLRLLRAWRKVREGRSFDTQQTSKSAQAIRVWAQEHGLSIGSRGRVPASIIAKYMAATQ